MGIPEQELPEQSGQIPLKSAELPQSTAEPELRPYLISFEKYNSKECEVSTDNKISRKALETLRDVGVNIRDEGDFAMRLPRMNISPVFDQGDYRALFRGLRDNIPDLEMKEIKIERDSGRLFFYVINKVFYVVAIRKSHYDTSKTR